MNAPLTNDQRLQWATPLRYKSDGVTVDFSADVEFDGKSLGIFQHDDIISLDADEARALRDWLNKVLP